MTTLATQTPSSPPKFARFAARGADHPLWLRRLRQAGMAAFERLGFPTLQDEEWRSTNIAAIAQTEFVPAAGRGPAEPPLPSEGEGRGEGSLLPLAGSPVTAADLAHFAIAGLDAHRLVFIDGRFAPALSSVPGSSVQGLPAGVIIESLAEAIARQPALLEAHLGRYARSQDDAFTALNTALLEDGLFVHVPPGVALDKPVYALFVSTPAARPTMVTVRNLVLVDATAQAVVIEDYVSLDAAAPGMVNRLIGESVDREDANALPSIAQSPDSGGRPITKPSAPAFTNIVTEVVAGADAVATHYMLEREDRKALNVSTLRIEHGRGSNVTSHSALLGGALVRNNVHPVLNGPGAECLVNGLYVTGGRQHVDNHMRVEHAQPHCNSRQFYKGVLDGQSRAVFAGRIIVHPDAQKTDAKQTNMNLLLSDEAQADSKPQLEIYADDVKCTHGATVGQIDAEALFYLRSRGLSLEAARSLLVYAFASDSLRRMDLLPVRQHLEAMLLERLPHGDVLRAML